MSTRTRASVGLASMALGLALGAAGCSRRAAPVVDAPRQEELSVIGVERQLRCGAPSVIGRSERTEACRVLRDFADGLVFDQWPAAGGTDVWIGREHQSNSNSESDDVGLFLLVRVSAGAPSAELVENYRIRREDVLGYTARDLPFTRFANPVDSVLGLERARAEGATARAVIAALADNRAPEADGVRWLRAMESDPAGFPQMRGPGAFVHTTGVSLRLYPGLYGYVRKARDGRRMLVAFPNGAAELWRLPST